jgi:hypothetical protein
MTKNQSWPGWTRCSAGSLVGSSRILIAIVVAGRPAQHPRGAPPEQWAWADHDVVVVLHVEQRVEVDLEGAAERQQDVEADRAFAGLDAADRRRAEVGSRGQSSSDSPSVVRRLRSRVRTTCSISSMLVAHIVFPSCEYSQAVVRSSRVDRIVVA